MPYGKALVDSIDTTGSLAITANVSVSGNTTVDDYFLKSDLTPTFVPSGSCDDNSLAY